MEVTARNKSARVKQTVAIAELEIIESQGEKRAKETGVEDTGINLASLNMYNQNSARTQDEQNMVNLKNMKKSKGRHQPTESLQALIVPTNATLIDHPIPTEHPLEMISEESSKESTKKLK